MNKKFSRVLALLLAFLMLVPTVPMSIFASAVDYDAADYLSFSVTSAGNASVGTDVIIYSGSSIVASGVTDQNGYVEFMQLDDAQLANSTLAVVGGYEVYGPLARALYYVDLTQQANSLENPELTVSTASLEMKYGDRHELAVSTNSDGAVTYEITSGSGVVTVDNGTVFAAKVGSAVIRVAVAETETYAAAYADVYVTVYPAVNAIKGFEKGDIPNAEAGKTYNNPVILAEENIGSVKYSSDNQDFATVDVNTGAVTITKNFLNVTTTARITATFTPDANSNYAAATASYVISADCTINWEAGRNEWVNSGFIVVTTDNGESEENITFYIDDKKDTVYLAPEGKIDITMDEIPEGSHDITVIIGDSKTVIRVNKDTVAPEFDVESLGSSWEKSAELNVKNIKDETSGAEKVGFNLKGSVTSINTIENNAVVLEDNFIPDGDYTATVTVFDKAGNKTSKTVAVKKDSTEDILNIDYTSGSWLTADSVLALKVTNAESDIVSIVPVVGETEKKNAVEESNGEYKLIVSELGLADGENEVIFVITDKAGNVSSNVTLGSSSDVLTVAAFNYDATAPSFTIAADGWFTDMSQSVEIADITDSGSGVKEVSYLDKNLHDINVISPDENGKYSVPLENLYFSAGKSMLTVYVKDNAGNMTEKSAEIKVDTTAPIVENIVIALDNVDVTSKTVNKLTYGYIFNESIVVTAQVSDPESGIPADRSAYTLLATNQFITEGENVITFAGRYDADKGTVTFTLPLTTLAGSAAAFKGTFEIVVKNNADLETAVFATDANSDGHAIISAEAVAPVVEYTDRPTGTQVEIDGEKQEWFSYNFSVPASFSDVHSGVRSYEVRINGNIVYSFTAENADSLLTAEKNITISFNGKDASKQQSISIVVVDHEGNEVTGSIPVNSMTNNYNVEVIVTDAAGNVASVADTFNAIASVATFNDVTPPVILPWLPATGDDNSLVRYDADGVVWYNQNVTFTISIYDEKSENSEVNDASGVNSADVKVVYGEKEDILTDTKVFGEDSDVVTASLYSYTTDKSKALSYEYFVSNVIDNNGNAYDGTVSGVINIDDIAPVVTNITVTQKDNADSNVLTKLANVLTFRKYFNDSVIVVAEGADYGPEGMADFASGVKEYVLYMGDSKETAKEIGRSTTGVFTIEDYFIDNKNLYVVAVDNVGNVSALTKDDEALNIDREAPKVEGPVFIQPEGVVKYLENDEKVWFSGDVEYKMGVSDNSAGIASIEVKINGVPVELKGDLDFSERVLGCEFTFSSEGIAVADDGSLRITYTIVDNAGNVTTNTTGSEEEKVANSKPPYTIYKDTNAPSLTSIVFTEKDGSDNQAEIVSFNEESNVYEITCDKETEIEITFSDLTAGGNRASGLKAEDGINVTFIPVEGDEFMVNTAVIKESDEKPGVYTWTYIFNQNFKGNIAIALKDNVDNSMINGNPANFTLESQEGHDAEADHITFALPGYPEKTHYNQDVTPVLSFKDTVAGISRINISVWAKDVDAVIPTQRYNESFDDFSHNFSNYSDFVVNNPEDIDKNYVIRTSIPLNINYEADDITIRATMYDNAGNSTTETYIFTIDKTAPVINATLSSSATPINSYYSSSVTATFVVNEHDFDGSTIRISEGVLSSWVPNTGDINIRTASATYSSDGAHNVVLTVTDRAGNSASYSVPQFYVDNTDPTITVTDIANNEATNADAVAFTLTARDSLCLATNPLTTTFSVWYKVTEAEDVRLVNETLGIDDLVDKNFITAIPSSGTTEYSYRIDFTKADDVYNDGIYALSCNVTDMSGRTSSTIICQNEDNTSSSVPSFTFSLNRMGSTYMVKWSGEDNSDIASLEKVNESVTNQPTDILIQEINPTPVNTESNATKITISDKITPKTVDSAPEVDTSKKFSVYTYTISKAAYFNTDGNYELRVESADMAGNVSDGEQKNFVAADFTVDTTSPVIKTELKNGFEMNVETYRASIEFTDISDCKVDILLNGETADVYLENTSDAQSVKASSLELTGSKIVYIDITGTGNEIQITSTDGLNAVTTETFKNISVSSSKFALFFAKLESMPWIYLIIVGVPVAVVAAVIIIKKKKNDDFADEKKAQKEKKSKK